LDYERQTRFVAEYMTKVDGAAMFHGIEARSPFLDYRLWEMAASLPYEVRLRGGELKAVLRALVRKHVGAEVGSRQKHGFTIPVQTWLATSWRPALTELVEGSLLESRGWIRRRGLRAGIKKALEEGRAPNQLWYLVVLEQWMRAEHTRMAAVA
jgi:asparagine synthase (glutamine-hydrolysing)